MSKRGSGAVVAWGDLCNRIREQVKSEIDLLEAASRFGVMPSTIRKVLEGRKISRYVEKKIRAALEGRAAPFSLHQRESYIERLLEVDRLYRRCGTLAAAGRVLGLTRERVRQLLNRGSEAGLFEYGPSTATRTPLKKWTKERRRDLKSRIVARMQARSNSRLRQKTHYSGSLIRASLRLREMIKGGFK